MDLVDEQDLVRLQVGQQRREIAGPLEDRPGGLLESRRPARCAIDVRERRLAEPGRPEDQHVIERVAALRAAEMKISICALTALCPT